MKYRSTSAMVSGAMLSKTPWPEAEVARFRETYFYKTEAILIDEVLSADAEHRRLVAVNHGRSTWLVAPYQRVTEGVHPPHVSGADILMLTTALGSLHGYFFHGCRWDEGWVGFGSRIEHAEFLFLANPRRPLELRSRETRARRGDKRALVEFEFEFLQDEKTFYVSKQLAMFVKPGVGA